MAGFRFPLEKVLGWRRTELEIAEAGFKREAAALQEIDRQMAECEAAGIRAELQVRGWDSVTGGDLEALGSFRLYVKAAQAEMARKRAEQARKLKAREALMMEARRRYRLLEKLKERRREEWTAEENRAVEAAASESYLAKWIREGDGR
jgi:flagellar export protein FliJ